jgi:hypothetical protein
MHLNACVFLSLPTTAAATSRRVPGKFADKDRVKKL